MTLQIKLSLAAIMAALAFSTGWIAKGWQTSTRMKHLPF